MKIDDLDKAFKRIHKKVAKLPWAHETKWSSKTHIWTESDDFGSMMVVDLHGLSVALAGEVINTIFSIEQKMDVGCLCFITGVGQHSATGPQIRPMAIELCEQQVEQFGWQLSLGHPGRIYVIYDPEKTPAVVIPRLTALMTWSIYLFTLILLLLLLRGMLFA